MSKRSNTQNYVLCISNGRYPASLEVRKIYQFIPTRRLKLMGKSELLMNQAKITFIRRTFSFLLRFQ